MNTRITVMVLLSLLVACQATVQEDDLLPISRSPHGVTIALRLIPDQRYEEVRGELLEATEESFLLVVAPTLESSQRRLIHVPMDSIKKIEFADGRVRPFPGSASKRKSLSYNLGLISRFPQNLSPELLQKLMDELKISEVESVLVE